MEYENNTENMNKILFSIIFLIFWVIFIHQRSIWIIWNIKVLWCLFKKRFKTGYFSKNTRKIIILGVKKIFENIKYCNEISDVGYDYEQKNPFVTVDEIGNESKIFFDNTILKSNFKLRKCGSKEIKNYIEDKRHCRYFFFNKKLLKNLQI